MRLSQIQKYRCYARYEQFTKVNIWPPFWQKLIFGGYGLTNFDNDLTVFRLQIAIKEFDIMLQFGIIKPCHGIKELLPSKSKVLFGANMRGEKSAEQVASSITAHHYTYEESSLSLHQHYSTSEQRFLEFRNEPHVCY
ncbi:hypothetical protein T03_10934 [Trichinella britovi]|uniref:Uncharacterized protein n=1 Tax=Trichinella britovi TaxID=45882 RepID=A0A0V1C9W5_TRIBR|nr:hypothetical protein T03_10934 [Trichinella britovi]